MKKCKCGNNPDQVKYESQDGICWQIKCTACERSSARRSTLNDAVDDWNDMTGGEKKEIPERPPLLLYYSDECREPKPSEEILTGKCIVRTDSGHDQWLRPTKRQEWGNRWIAKQLVGDEIPMLNSKQLRALASYISDPDSSILKNKLSAEFPGHSSSNWYNYIQLVLRSKAKKLEEIGQ